jgi:hypothetical protein
MPHRAPEAHRHRQLSAASCAMRPPAIRRAGRRRLRAVVLSGPPPGQAESASAAAARWPGRPTVPSGHQPARGVQPGGEAGHAGGAVEVVPRVFLAAPEGLHRRAPSAPARRWRGLAMKSTSSRRPKPPPSSVTFSVTCSLSTPAPAPRRARQRGTWVGAHTVARPSATCTVQFMGSSARWASQGRGTRPARCARACARAAGTSPRSWYVQPVAVSSSRAMRSMASALSTAAAGTCSSQVISTASRRLQGAPGVVGDHRHALRCRRSSPAPPAPGARRALQRWRCVVPGHAAAQHRAHAHAGVQHARLQARRCRTRRDLPPWPRSRRFTSWPIRVNCAASSAPRPSSRTAGPRPQASGPKRERLARRVGHLAVAHGALAGRHAPLRGRGHQHGAGRGAGLAHGQPQVLHAGRAAGDLRPISRMDLAVIHCSERLSRPSSSGWKGRPSTADGICCRSPIGRRVLHLHAGPVGVQLVGQHHGQRGVTPWPISLLGTCTITRSSAVTFTQPLKACSPSARGSGVLRSRRCSSGVRCGGERVRGQACRLWPQEAA